MTASIKCHMTTETQLRRLKCPSVNIRKSYDPEAMKQLKASIRSLGVLSPLAVIDKGDGSFEVVAGQRRLRALLELYPGGKGEGDVEVDVPIIIVPSDDPTEISLAENVVREEMHPADQFVAFKSLIDGGRDIAEIASDFAVSERVVKGRLRLANVSPTIFTAYREGKLKLSQVEAFAIVEDHEDQDAVFNSRTDWENSYSNGPSEIRKLLTKKIVRGNDKRVTYVGLDAYEAAGGTLYRDLFSEDAENVLIYDVKLLDKLAKEKLQAAADAVTAEGWSWVEVQTKPLSYAQSSKFKNRKPEKAELSEEDKTAIKELEEKQEKLIEEKGDEDGELNDADEAAYAEMEEQIDAIKAKQTVWNDKAKKASGVIISIDQYGRQAVSYGLIKPPEKSKEKAVESPDEVKEAQKIDRSWLEIVNDLVSQKLVAVAAGLAHAPGKALAVLVHGLALDTFDEDEWDISPRALTCVGNGNGSSDVTDYVEETEEGTSKGADALTRMKVQWKKRIPTDPTQLLDWCLAQEQETLLELLAFLTAMGLEDRVNTWQGYTPEDQNGPNEPLNVLGRIVGTDMAAWYTPTRENYFDKISKARLLSDMGEAKGGAHPEGREKLKEADLADLAARELPASGWIPEPARIPQAVQAEAKKTKTKKAQAA